MNMMTRLLVNKHADKDEIKHMLNTPKNLTCESEFYGIHNMWMCIDIFFILLI
jgi:hypothetical protein